MKRLFNILLNNYDLLIKSKRNYKIFVSATTFYLCSSHTFKRSLHKLKVGGQSATCSKYGINPIHKEAAGCLSLTQFLLL